MHAGPRTLGCRYAPDADTRKVRPAFFDFLHVTKVVRHVQLSVRRTTAILVGTLTVPEFTLASHLGTCLHGPEHRRIIVRIRRTFGGIAAVLALVGLGAPLANAAAPKAGGRCTPSEVGKTVSGLTCVKNGSLRRWQKAVAAATTVAPAPGATAAAASGGGSTEPVKLGIALGQTGSTTANLAQDQTIGVKLAEKWVNDNGGINGRPLKLVIQDTGPDEAGAIAAFNTLINSDKVVGIVGPTLSQQAFSADPIADRAKVPVLAPSNTAARIPQIGDYIARVSAGVASYAGNAIKYAGSLQAVSRAAVFFAQDDAFSRSETAVFQTAVKAEGLELLAPQTFNAADTDFTTQTAFVQTNKPDLVVISGLAPAGNLVRQLRELGFKGIIVGGNGLNVVQTFSVCKQLCDGLIVAQAYSPEIPNDGANAEFRKRFKAEQKREPGQIAAQAFTGVQVFAESLRAIDKAGKLTDDLGSTRTALNTQILGGKYVTPLGDISFDKEGEIIQKSFYVAQIKMQRGETSDIYSGKFNYVKF
jgi:branched-chain amino acid transport system substrate-binding protein